MAHALPNSTSTTPAASASVPERRSALDSFLVAIGAILLIGGEILLAAIAIVWALHGLLETRLTGDIILIALVAPPALWAVWKTIVLAISAERIRDEDL